MELVVELDQLLFPVLVVPETGGRFVAGGDDKVEESFWALVGEKFTGVGVPGWEEEIECPDCFADEFFWVGTWTGESCVSVFLLCCVWGAGRCFLLRNA